ncbi:hypothetical protein AgCh_024489 [Apium graveolens]
MNRTKLSIRERIGNVPQFPIGVDVVVAEEDLYYPHPLIQDILWRTLHKVVEPFLMNWPGKKLREKSLCTVMEHIHYEDENTRYICIMPVNKGHLNENFSALENFGQSSNMEFYVEEALNLFFEKTENVPIEMEQELKKTPLDLHSVLILNTQSLSFLDYQLGLLGFYTVTVKSKIIEWLRERDGTTPDKDAFDKVFSEYGQEIIYPPQSMSKDKGNDKVKALVNVSDSD